MTMAPHSTVPASTATTAEPATQGHRPLRLELAAAPHAGRLAGAWWPYSRDLEAELAHLVDDFPAAAGRVCRVNFSRPDWDAPANPGGTTGWSHSITARRGRVKVGSFPHDDTHVVMLIMGLYNQERLSLLVLPPDLGADDAHRLSAAAASPDNRLDGGELLASLADTSAPEHALPTA